MNNPFFNAMSRNNMLPMLRQIKSNPMQVLLQRGFDIPQNIANNPNAILNHLLSSGQISQDQVNAAYQAGRQFKGM